MGKKALLSHAAGKKHSEKDIKIKIFFKPANQKKFVAIIQSLNQLKMTMVVAQILLQ